MRALIAAMTFAISGLLSSPSVAQEENYSVVLKGQCRMELVQGAGFGPCADIVLCINFKNHVSAVLFVEPKGDTKFVLKGEKDRQPNLENYFLSVDTLTIKPSDGTMLEDHNMEGECHFFSNKAGSKFVFVKCDIYDRAHRIGGRFYLEHIRETTVNRP